MRGARPDLKKSELELSMRPGHFKGARHSFAALVFGRERERALTGIGGQSYKSEFHPAARGNASRTTQAENRIEDATHRAVEVSFHRLRRPGRTGAPQKRAAVGLKLDRTGRARDYVGAPDRRLIRRTRTPAR